jgi:hypothetical protein
MMRIRSRSLAAVAVVMLVAGLWLSLHRSSELADLGGGLVFADLMPALGEITEIRLSRGDGSRTTLRKVQDKEGSGWTVVEREFPADASRVRELALGLANMKFIERKTADPAFYAKLGVEAPDTPTATGTLVEVVAGSKSWALIVGKNAEGRTIYVRQPKEAASALVAPNVIVEPDPKRWIDRELLDLPGASVHDISVRPAGAPAYLLSRAKRGDVDLVLSPIPKGRSAASSMSLNGQADALTGFNFDDMRALPASPPPATDHATFRTFDGQVFEFTGRREADKAWVTVNASRDAALAAQFPEAPPATPAPASAPAAAAAPAPAPPASPAPAAAPDMGAERLAARAQGLEFEIPLYKYETLFRKQEDLLEN